MDVYHRLPTELQYHIEILLDFPTLLLFQAPNTLRPNRWWYQVMCNTFDNVGAYTADADYKVAVQKAYHLQKVIPCQKGAIEACLHTLICYRRYDAIGRETLEIVLRDLTTTNEVILRAVVGILTEHEFLQQASFMTWDQEGMVVPEMALLVNAGYWPFMPQDEVLHICHRWPMLIRPEILRECHKSSSAIDLKKMLDMLDRFPTVQGHTTVTQLRAVFPKPT